jgi:hypothetical protein
MYSLYHADMFEESIYRPVMCMHYMFFSSQANIHLSGLLPADSPYLLLGAHIGCQRFQNFVECAERHRVLDRSLRNQKQ